MQALRRHGGIAIGLCCAFAALVACAGDCPLGHSSEELETPTSRTTVCTNSSGQYDGPVRGVDRRQGGTVEFSGSYKNEAPHGRLTCTRTETAERLEIEWNAEAFAESLWGIPLSEVGPMSGGRHLAPTPHMLCPGGDWAELSTNGFTVALLGSLEERGVARVVSYVGPVP